MTVGIAYVDGPRLARSLFAAADWVAAGREEINRINVFPVPDGDTGTNFSLTLRAVADALRALGDAPLPETARTMARAAVLGARGQLRDDARPLPAGLRRVARRPAAPRRTRDVAAALRQGADRLYESLDDPREGTILTVAREAAAAAERAAAETDDIGEFMRRLLAEGEVALARTPELMAVLKEAGVVDAGGKGFVRMLEGVVRYIEGDPILAAGRRQRSRTPQRYWSRRRRSRSRPSATSSSAPRCWSAASSCRRPTRSGRRCTRFGGSVVVAVMADILKIHVHTDTPEAVFSYAARWGRVETTKADDMRAQHRRLAHADRRPVAVVTDSSADLADSVLDRHHIALVPLQVVFGDETFRDRVELKPEEFYRRLRTARDLPTTSQPTPAEFVRVLRDARGEADEVVAVLLSGSLSGTFASAQAAVRAAGHLRMSTWWTAGRPRLGVGMLALAGRGAGRVGLAGAEIAPELERVRGQSGMLLTVDRYDNLLRSGRVSRGKAWIAGMLDVKPILSLDRSRTCRPGGPGARPGAAGAPGAGAAGAAAHAAAPSGPVRRGAHRGARRWPSGCARRWSRRTGRGTASSPSRPACSAPTWAPGAWAIFYQVEDGTPARLDAATAGAEGSTHMQERIRPVTPRIPEALRLALDAIQDLKGSQLVVLDLRGLTDATDFFVIASGTSDAHVRGIAESVMEKLDRKGHHTHHVEGLNGGRWVLLDFVDFVVHLFHPETRSFYQLERLWDDAPELLISST